MSKKAELDGVGCAGCLLMLGLLAICAACLIRICWNIITGTAFLP